MVMPFVVGLETWNQVTTLRMTLLSLLAVLLAPAVQLLLHLLICLA